jgi:large subunit ribosomal protein L22
MTEKDYNPNQKERKAMEAQPKKQESVAKTPLKKPEEKKPETKKKEAPRKIVKKDFAVVNVRGVPISTKYAIEICRFIKGKTIADAVKVLEEVLRKKKAVPMRGEYGHKRGIMSGRYPKVATEHFIRLLRSLGSNSVANGIDVPVVSEAIANLGARPMARFGRWQRKRTHIKLVAREKKEIKKNGGNK